MENILVEIDRLLMQIQVSGDDVFIMAEARAKVKRLYQEMTEAKDGK